MIILPEPYLPKYIVESIKILFDVWDSEQNEKNITKTFFSGAIAFILKKLVLDFLGAEELLL